MSILPTQSVIRQIMELAPGTVPVIASQPGTVPVIASQPVTVPGIAPVTVPGIAPVTVPVIASQPVTVPVTVPVASLAAPMSILPTQNVIKQIMELAALQSVTLSNEPLQKLPAAENIIKIFEK
jgi:hypothetical protein